MSKQTFQASDKQERKINVNHPHLETGAFDSENDFDKIMYFFNQEYEQLLKFFRETQKVTRNELYQDPFHVIITSISPDQKPDLDNLEALATHTHVQENGVYLPVPLVIRQTMSVAEAKFFIYGRKRGHQHWVLTPLILDEKDKDLFSSLPIGQPTLIKTSELKFKVEKALRRHIKNLHDIPVTNEVGKLLEEITKRFCEKTKIFIILETLKALAGDWNSRNKLATVRKKLFAFYEEAGDHVGGTSQGDFYKPLLDYMDENYTPLEKIRNAQQYIKYASTILDTYGINPDEWTDSAISQAKDYALNGLEYQRDLINYIRRPPLSTTEASALFQPVTYPRLPVDTQLLPVMLSRLCIIYQVVNIFDSDEVLEDLAKGEEIRDALFILRNQSKWGYTKIRQEHYIRTLREFTAKFKLFLDWMRDGESIPANFREMEKDFNTITGFLKQLPTPTPEGGYYPTECISLCQKFPGQSQEEQKQDLVSGSLSTSASSSSSSCFSTASSSNPSNFDREIEDMMPASDSLSASMPSSSSRLSTSSFFSLSKPGGEIKDTSPVSSSVHTDASLPSALQESSLYAEASRPGGKRKRKQPGAKEVETSSKFERH